MIHDVSIPRSGFWVFKRQSAALSSRPLTRFNPSVGILGVQAAIASSISRLANEFQSLGRDSGCSSRSSSATGRMVGQVSIPRSGFWVFKRYLFGFTHIRDKPVSIPRSGFWVFKRV